MIDCIFNLLASATTTPTIAPTAGALTEALRISGVAMMAIFVVMGLFGALISLIGKACPEDESPS